MTEKIKESRNCNDKIGKLDKSNRNDELFNFDAPRTFKASQSFKQNPDILLYFGVNSTENINKKGTNKPADNSILQNNTTINNKIEQQSFLKCQQIDVDFIYCKAEKPKSKRVMKTSAAISAAIDKDKSLTIANNQPKNQLKPIVVRPINSQKTQKSDNTPINASLIHRSKSVKDRELHQKEKTMSYLYCPIMHEYSLIKLVSIY